MPKTSHPLSPNGGDITIAPVGFLRHLFRRRRKVNLEDFLIPEVKDGTIDFIIVKGEVPQIIMGEATVPSATILGTVPPAVISIDGVAVIQDEDQDV